MLDAGLVPCPITERADAPLTSASEALLRRLASPDWMWGCLIRAAQRGSALVWQGSGGWPWIALLRVAETCEFGDFGRFAIPWWHGLRSEGWVKDSRHRNR